MGGLECLCKFADATSTYYQRIRSYRYERGISPNEDIAGLAKSSNLAAIDSYAFGVLAEDILKNLQATGTHRETMAYVDILSFYISTRYKIPQALCHTILDETPNLLEFREFCKENLQNPDTCLRGSVTNVLQHSFFTHEFIRIHAFLEELPLKTDAEREEFFT